jgi:hypothetical protein
VVACRIFGGQGVVEHYYNGANPKSSALLVATNASIGLSDLSITKNNSALTCSFRRVKFIPGVNNYCNLNNNYYVLLAGGTSTQSEFNLLFFDSALDN